MKVLLAVVVASLATGSAQAQTYPARPITIISGIPPGSGTDTFARIFGERMKATLGQPLIIEHVTGAGGTIGAARAARAAPDGYTLSVGNVGSHVVSPATYPNVQYHPLDDFEPVALLVTNPYWLVARKSMPPNDLKELIAWLKANPDKASLAMVGVGGIDQIMGTYFQQKTGTKFQFVPYRGGGPAIQDLVAGHVDLRLDPISGSLGPVRSGQLKAYAVLGDIRSPAAPDIPTTEELDVPGLKVTFWFALWAPKGTPKPIIAKLNAAALEAYNDATVRKRAAEFGADIPPPALRSPEAFGAFHKAEIDKWWPFIKSSNIRAQ